MIYNWFIYWGNPQKIFTRKDDVPSIGNYCVLCISEIYNFCTWLALPHLTLLWPGREIHTQKTFLFPWALAWSFLFCIFKGNHSLTSSSSRKCSKSAYQTLTWGQSESCLTLCVAERPCMKSEDLALWEKEKNENFHFQKLMIPTW